MCFLIKLSNRTIDGEAGPEENVLSFHEQDLENVACHKTILSFIPLDYYYKFPIKLSLVVMKLKDKADS